MRFTDGMIALPLLPLLIVLGALDLTKLGFSADFAHSGAAGFWRVVVIIALVDWTGIARLTRAATLALRDRDYVRSARASGGSARYVMASHILPNVATPLIVAVTLTVGPGHPVRERAELPRVSASSRPPHPGATCSTTRRTWSPPTRPSRSIPGLLIFITVIAVNFLGDGLQHAFDPRSQR